MTNTQIGLPRSISPAILTLLLLIKSAVPAIERAPLAIIVALLINFYNQTFPQANDSPNKLH